MQLVGGDACNMIFSHALARQPSTRQPGRGGAALVKEMHPNWGPDAVKAAVQRSAQHLDCPTTLFPDDPRERCYGDGGRTSFFSHGLVDALEAAQE